jgi:hypothetical protein
MLVELTLIAAVLNSNRHTSAELEPNRTVEYVLDTIYTAPPASVACGA